jgi:hypothetical protein
MAKTANPIFDDGICYVDNRNYLKLLMMEWKKALIFQSFAYII